jgi:hypothetical protein
MIIENLGSPPSTLGEGGSISEAKLWCKIPKKIGDPYIFWPSYPRNEKSGIFLKMHARDRGVLWEIGYKQRPPSILGVGGGGGVGHSLVTETKPAIVYGSRVSDGDRGCSIYSFILYIQRSSDSAITGPVGIRYDSMSDSTLDKVANHITRSACDRRARSSRTQIELSITNSPWLLYWCTHSLPQNKISISDI